MTKYLRGRKRSAFRKRPDCVRSAVAGARWSEVTRACTDALDELDKSPGVVEGWKVAGHLLFQLGRGSFFHGEFATARTNLERSLACAVIDIRLVFPWLARAAWECGDVQGAKAALYEYRVAGRDVLPSELWLDGFQKLLEGVGPPPRAASW